MALWLFSTISGLGNSIDIPFKVNKLRTQIGYLASIFYEYPCQNMHIIGVTGTNGKNNQFHLIAPRKHVDKVPVSALWYRSVR